MAFAFALGFRVTPRVRVTGSVRGMVMVYGFGIRVKLGIWPWPWSGLWFGLAGQLVVQLMLPLQYYDQG